MYADTKPCQVCGSRVDLRPRTDDDALRVAEADGTPDERVCANVRCPTNQPGGDQRSP